MYEAYSLSRKKPKSKMPQVHSCVVALSSLVAMAYLAGLPWDW